MAAVQTDTSLLLMPVRLEDSPTGTASPPSVGPPPPDTDDLTLKEWPRFSWDACPGLLGDFVRLATRNSEADPAAVCITALVRFGAEVHSYGGRSGLGPHFYIGETIHPPRLFAVICGNSSKARKGTSRHPMTKLLGREHCQPADLKAWGVALPARESGGPLSTGEGLATLKSAVRTLQAEQTALTAHLTRLNAVYESLQPLLTRLNALLPGK